MFLETPSSLPHWGRKGQPCHGATALVALAASWALIMKGMGDSYLESWVAVEELKITIL